MKCSTKQMEEHHVDRSRYPFASFVCGRGWRGHKTEEAAFRAARRDVNRFVKAFGGGEPQNLVARTDTGESL